MSTHRKTAKAPPTNGPIPRYIGIGTKIIASIRQGKIQPGTVLTEEPIARFFGTSRTPVRTALNMLSDQGYLQRFEGRGFLVSGESEQVTEALRQTLTPEMFGLSTDTPDFSTPLASEIIARDFENSLILALPFGQFMVNEQAAANHYDVSRTVMRELLSRLQTRGILHKDKRSHWLIGPLTAREIAQYFSVRVKLEPLALQESASRIPMADIQVMMQRLQSGIDKGYDLSKEDLEDLESDLHIHLLSGCKNPHLLRMVHQSQLALIVNRVFASFVGTSPFIAPLQEHRFVLEFLLMGATPMAANALEEHLNRSAIRTRKRLMSISVFPQPDLPDYLKRRDF